MIGTILVGVGAVVLVLVVVGGALALWPGRFAPERWTPPTAPSLDEGPYARNRALAAIERVDLGGEAGPETVTVGPDGALYTGVASGAIVRVAPDGSRSTVATTGGRPDGLAFDPAGALVVCDCTRGLLRIDRGTVHELAPASGDPPVRFANDLAIAADGTIYFTSSSSRYDVADDVLALLEHRPTGAVLRHDPASGATTVLVRGLHFANGICLGPDDEYLLVVETGAYCVRRVWLRGPRTGENEIFVDNLPGFPDNIRWNRRDTFWLAIASVRDRAADRLLFPRPWLRRVVARLPRALLPGPRPHAIILGFDHAGRLVHNLQDDSRGCYEHVTCVDEVDGVLWIGSYRERAIARLPAPGR